MSNPDPKVPIQTNEEVLEEEIRDLERPPLKSWIVWGGTLVLLVAAVVIVAVFVRINRVGEEARQAERIASIPPVELPVRGPMGILDRPPEAFRWTAMEGAASYVVVVRERHTGEVIVQRPSSRPYLAPTDVESSNFVPGLYVWTVEALRADGSRMAGAETLFEVVEASPTENASTPRTGL
jgi:hypothetical protein